MTKKEVTQNINGSNNITTTETVNIENYNVTEVIQKLPSMLSKALPTLVDIVFEEKEENLPEIPYSIAEKLEYNSLRVCKVWVEEYNEYGKTIDTIYETLDDDRPRAKKRIFKYLTSLYLNEKVACLLGAQNKSEIEVIRENSDVIFENVVAKVKQDLEKSSIEGVNIEDIAICSYVIVSHGFINCKVLEKVAK